MAITALTDLETFEVSLVPDGANKQPRFPILKRTERVKMSDTLHAVLDAPNGDEAQFNRVIKSADISEEAEVAVKGAMKILSAYSDIIPASKALGLVSKGLGVAKDETAYPEKRMKQEGEEEEEAEKQEGEEEVEKPEGRPEDYLPGKQEGEEEEEAEEGEEEEEEEEAPMLAKSSKLPPEIRAEVKALWKSQKAATVKAEKLAKALATERDTRLRKEFIEKAKKDYRYIPGKSSEELGLLMKSLHVFDSKIADEIGIIFKSVSEVVEKSGLLNEIGSNIAGSGTSAYSRLDAMAKDKVTKGNVTYAKAFTDAMNENPDLYSQYLDEQQG